MATTEREYLEFSEHCFEGRLSQTRDCLDAGLSPNGHESQRDYERPLAMAVLGKQHEAARLLVDRGADPNHAAPLLDECMEDPQLHFLVDRILADPSPDASEHLQSFFVKAVRDGDRPLAQRLLAACPPPGEFATRRSPLAEAIRSGREELALWLLQLGFEPFVSGHDEPQPAALAVVADLDVVLAKLLELGVSPETQVNGHLNRLRLPPPLPPRLHQRLKHVRDFPRNAKFEVFHEGSLLHVAAVTGSPKCAALLLQAGVDPTAVDSEGRTPAMLAALGGDATRSVLELLPEADLSNPQALTDLLTRSLKDEDLAALEQAIEHGADVNQPVESEYSTHSTPLIVAACKGNVAMIRALLEAGADLEQIDWPPGEKPQMAGLKMFLDESGWGCLTQLPIASARTPLAWAALYGRADAMRCLREAGADVQATDVFGLTALHLAAVGDHPDAVELAVEFGLDLHAEAVRKTTPLHAAAEANAARAVDALIQAGADPTRLNQSGESPLVVAKEWGKPAARKRLQPHTPEAFQRKTRRSKPTPAWHWNADQFQKLLSRAKTAHGKAAGKLATARFRDHLAKAAKAQAFQSIAERIRTKLKADQLHAWEEAPQLRFVEAVKISDARLLRLQHEFLEQGAFIVRELHSRDDLKRIFVAPTTELPELIAAFGTNGVNMGFDPDLTLAWLMDLYDRRPYRLIGVMHDGVELRFDQSIAEPDDLVEELMTACPPPAEEDATVKRLRRRLKSKTPQVLLWWD